MSEQATSPGRLGLAGLASVPAKAADLTDDALPHLAPGQTAAQLLDALVAASLTEDAVRLVGQALAKREAVWWAFRCAGTAPRPQPEGPPSEPLAKRHADAVAAEDGALKAVERWCAGPADDRRRAANDAGEKIDDSPAGLAGMACYFADGSISPADCPAVPAPPDVCGKLAAAAVLLAAVRDHPEEADAKRLKFVQLARDVDAGKDRWKDVLTPGAVPPPVGPAVPVSKEKRRTSYY